MKRGTEKQLKKTTMLVLAVTLHNIPEGMAVGVVVCRLGIGQCVDHRSRGNGTVYRHRIQNFPEGAIISMPLRAEGMGKGKAFLYGTLSGVVEPIGAILTILAAAGAADSAVSVEFRRRCHDLCGGGELIPEMSEAPHSNVGTIFFAVGFALYDDAGRGVGIMEMAGFCGEQKPVFCGRFSFLETAAFPLDNPPEMCYTKVFPNRSFPERKFKKSGT